MMCAQSNFWSTNVYMIWRVCTSFIKTWSHWLHCSLWHIPVVKTLTQNTQHTETNRNRYRLTCFLKFQFFNGIYSIYLDKAFLIYSSFNQSLTQVHVHAGVDFENAWTNSIGLDILWNLAWFLERW